jgi:hypothetical protein
MHARNAGLQRLRRATRRIGLLTAVLTGVFAGLAAASNSGHHKRVLRRAVTPRRPAAPAPKPAKAPPPPSLPALPAQSGDNAPPSPAPPPSPQPSPQPAPAPQPPPAPPVQSYSPPVTSSGGS